MAYHAKRQGPPTERANLYQQITGRIIGELEAGREKALSISIQTARSF